MSADERNALPDSAGDDWDSTDDAILHEVNAEHLREFLPTAFICTLALRKLQHIRHFYPNALTDEEAHRLHDQLRRCLELHCQTVPSPGLREYHRLVESGESDVDFAMALAFSAHFSDYTDSESDWAEREQQAFQTALPQCDAEVQAIVERIDGVMLLDCRIPNPPEDPTFQEPRRFFQMLRHYWQPCRDFILSDVTSRCSVRPHPLSPLIVNLQDRILQCCEALAGDRRIAKIKENVTSLLDTMLHDSFVDLDEERTRTQLQQIDVAIERLQLDFGSGTYPLTLEEDYCLEVAARTAQEYAVFLENTREQLDGHLGLIVDMENRKVRRRGYEAVVDLSRSKLKWHTFLVFYAAGQADASEDAWRNGYPGTWKPDPVRQIRLELKADMELLVLASIVFTPARTRWRFFNGWNC